MLLAASQEAAVQACIEISSTNYGLHNLLLHGPNGAGKRTLARSIAAAAGFHLIEVPLSGAAAASLRQRLFGGADEAARAAGSGAAPGDAGTGSGSILFFSELEGLHPDFWQDFHRLLSTRTYIDGGGGEWRLANDVWIIAAITTLVRQPQVDLSHWLCTAFYRRYGVNPISNPTELRSVCAAIAQEISSSCNVDESVERVFDETPLPHDNLHAVRRWIESAARPHTKVLDESVLRTAMTEDLGWLLSNVQYRGKTITHGFVSGWLEQMPSAIRGIAMHLVRQIASRYFISAYDTYSSIEYLIKMSGIPPGGSVSFCRWQGIGKSPDRIAHMLKNQGNWRVRGELNLHAPERTWPTVAPNENHWFVIADDFVGTGNTISKLMATTNSPLRRFVRNVPHAQLRFLIIAGFDQGIRRISAAATESCGANAKVIVARLFDDGDRCFHAGSRVLTNSSQQNTLRTFCVELGKTKLRHLPSDMYLGYDGFGGLVVLADTVPNDSLPMIWCPGKAWRPLFPAAGLPAD